MPGERGNLHLKEHTVSVDVDDNRTVKASKVIEELEKTFGVGSVVAVVPRSGNLYEITVNEKRYVDELANSGFQVGGIKYDCHAIYSSEKLVSFMHLPAFIEDADILNKLTALNIEVTSPIKRKKHPGTNVADGTRYLLCKFPPNVSSLPYTMKFEIDTNKHEYVRVKHDHQFKVCSKCMSDEHLYAECPRNQCYRCNQMGHLARDCPCEPCSTCHNYPRYCSCGWAPAAENIDDGVSDDESQVKREFQRMERERAHKMDNDETERKQTTQMDDENKQSNDDKDENKRKSDDDWTEVGRDTEVLPSFKDAADVEYDDGTFSSFLKEQKQNSNSEKLIVDCHDELLNLPLKEGPFSKETSEQSVSHMSNLDPSMTGTDVAEAGESMEEECEETGTEYEGDDSQPSRQHFVQVVHKIKKPRRKRLVSKPHKTPDELARLRNKNKSKVSNEFKSKPKNKNTE